MGKNGEERSEDAKIGEKEGVRQSKYNECYIWIRKERLPVGISPKLSGRDTHNW